MGNTYLRDLVCSIIIVRLHHLRRSAEQTRISKVFVFYRTMGKERGTYHDHGEVYTDEIENL